MAGSNASSSSTDPAQDNKLSWQQQKEEKARTQKLKRDIDRVEKKIERLETENASLEAEMADPQVATNSVRLQELATRKADNDARLEELMEQWEALSS